ncbi:nucleotidyltransferase-like protein [Brevibacillus ginsengisoli]|uniref:nucleotidyltransferase-like protein n=1 Tax=Brevibacillus ginsengisoli TaxID=363854 RepID=UPI003CEBBB04
MNQELQKYQENILRQQHVLSVLLLDNREDSSLVHEGKNLIYLIVLNQPGEKWETSYLICQDQIVVEHRIHQWHLEQLSLQGTDHYLYSLLRQGEVIFDQHDYLRSNRDRLTRLSHQMRKRRICEEYSVFLQYFLEAKELLHQNHTMDAFQAVLKALNGWARLVVIEAGEIQEAVLWNQVKRLEPTIYKLYEELIAGSEPLEKRMELLLLPIEFQIMSKMKEATCLITDIINTQNKPWTYEELKRHPEITDSRINLGLLLDKMLRRSFIQSVPVRMNDKVVEEQGFCSRE